VNLIEERAARNEALFREVNKRIEELHDASGEKEGALVCECGDDTCRERLTVPLDTYETVRNDPRLSSWLPDTNPAIERSIEHDEGFVVVRKGSTLRPRAERKRARAALRDVPAAPAAAQLRRLGANRAARRPGQRRAPPPK
jgi:hypothetical protein